MESIRRSICNAHASLRPIQPPSLPPDLESPVQSAANPHLSSETDYIDSARKEIGVWIAAAAPLAMFYYKSQPNVPSLLRFGLFSFTVAAMIYFIGIHIHDKLPGIAKVMVQAGVGLAAITYIGAMLSMII